jgi:hypothetical protein
MRRIPFLASLFALTVCALPAWPADLTKIERTIAKEPEYQSKAPKYCLLVFGAQATTKVWLVADGDVLHVSNSEGDLTGAGSRMVRVHKYTGGERFFVGHILDADGKPKHTGLDFYRDGDSFRLKFEGRDRTSRQVAGDDPANKLRFAERPQDAPIVHFGGPIEIAMYGSKPSLSRGSTEFRFGIGTPGVGQGTFAAFQGCASPEGARHGEITADIELPKTGAPGETIKVQAVLRNRH